MRSLFLITALIACAGAAQAQARRGTPAQYIEAKVALESSEEKRLEQILKRVLASDDVLVTVNADLYTDAEHAEAEVMPGVAPRETPASPTPLELPSSLVRRLTVTIFVPLTATDSQVDLAQKTAQRMIGLNAARGDTLTVQKLDFQKRTSPPPEAPREPIVSPHTLLSLSWLAFAAAALFLLSRRFFDPLMVALRDVAGGLSERPAPRAAPAAREAAAPAEAAAAQAASASSPAKADDHPSSRRVPFDFVEERDIPSLNILLQKFSPEEIAVVVHYLSPSLASQVLAALDENRRDAVLSHMTRTILLNPGDVRALEESIRSNIDYMVGGEDKLAAILNQSASRLQAGILSRLRGIDQTLWKHLQSRVITLDDVGLLDEAGLSALSRAVPMKSMAAALKTSPDVAARVLEKLTGGGLGEWLKQELELSGELPEEAAAAESQRVVSALVQLVKEGKIVLRKAPPSRPPVQEPSAPLPSAVEPPAVEAPAAEPSAGDAPAEPPFAAPPPDAR